MAVAALVDNPPRSYRWSRSNYTPLGRLLDIGAVASQFLFFLWKDRQADQSGRVLPEARSVLHRKRAAWLQESLLQLGPTFIKIGQFFSTRSDLFPAEYIEELSTLQDQVPAFDAVLVKAIVERELDKPVEAIFSELNLVPIASASLGQVHQGTLQSGRSVAVKVQRPGLQRLFEIDLNILRGIVETVQYRTIWGKQGHDWIGIYEECRRTLWEEVDYLNEGRNADTFRRNFRDQDKVTVPRIYWRYTTPRLLTMEYVPGIKVSSGEALVAAGIDQKAIAHLGAESYLRQLLQHGFFHADPHPGNIAVDARTGGLIFYDFGMMGRVPKTTKDSLMITLSGIIRQDAGLVVESMVALGALAPDTDLGPVRRSVQYMLENFMTQSLGSHEAVSMASISDDLYELSYGQPFRFPATFTFVLRALSTLEAWGKSLDPSFNFMAVAQPLATELMTQSPGNSNSFFDQLGLQAAQFTNTSLNLPQRAEKALNHLEQGDIKIRMTSVETDRELRKLNSVGVGLIYTLLCSVLILSGTQMMTVGFFWVGGGMMALAGLMAIALGTVLFKL